VQDARVLDNKFLSLLIKSQWSIYSLTGRQMLPPEWDEIQIHNHVIVLRKGKTWHLLTRDQLAALAEAKSVSFSAPYSEIKFLPSGKVWIKSKKLEGILDQTLTEIVPLNQHNITPSFFGFMARSADGLTVYDQFGKASSHFEMAMDHEPWLAVRKKREWYLFDPVHQQYQSRPYDSVRFEGPFVLGFLNDSLTVHFTREVTREFTQPIRAHFIPGKDSTSFLVTELEEKIIVNKRRGRVETTTKRTLYNLRGVPLFTVNYDQILYAGQDLFIVTQKEKKGLMDATGRLLLPVTFDAIGSVSNNMVSLLNRMKFGLYHVEKQKLIQPQYDKNLVPYTTERMAAYYEGRYGFIDWDNKVQGDYAFEEIRFWNDTAALVKKNGLWSFYEVEHRREIMSGIKDVNIFSNTPTEKVAIIQRDNYYGVVSSMRGTIIPLAFTDLVNVGSPEEPLFFTEKHVPEASLFVVIYYDKDGKFIRREVYDEAEDYEKIYCGDK
jgi:hypothetical protein